PYTTLFRSIDAAWVPLARPRCARGVVRVDRCIHGGAPERGRVSLADTIGRRQKSSARVALVTGAAQGLGLATAMLLARQGYELVLADLQNLDAVLGRLRAQGVEVEATQGDVASESYVRGLAESIAARHAALDVLVNNAGVSCIGPAEDTTAEQWQRVMAVNLFGPFLLCKYLGAQ